MKEVPLRVRLSAAENDHLLAAVARSGLSKSEYVRWALKNSNTQVLQPVQPKPKPKPKPPPVPAEEPLYYEAESQLDVEPQLDVLTAMGIAPPPDDDTVGS